jgi:serine/threonine protein kinase
MPEKQDAQTKTQSAPDPLIGLTLGGRYELLARIGDGGTGIIYKARHTATEAMVAIKLIHRTLICDKKAVQRFQQEAKILGNLQHPNIIGVKAIDADSGLCFLVMEYAEGTSLSSLIKKEGTIGQQKFHNIFAQAASGLAYAHSKGVIHRDIKPSNLILMTMPNGTEVLKVLDFGLSKLIGASDQLTTESGICIGSPHYMSPEQCKGSSADKRSDIYSLGCVMFEALAGKPPFEGVNNIQIADKHLTEPVPVIGGKELRPMMRIIGKCLAKNPDERYQTMEELLTAFHEGESLSLKYQTVPKKPKSNKRSLVPLLSLAVVALLAVGSVLYMSKKQADEAGEIPTEFGLVPPGLAVQTFSELVNRGETPPAASLRRVENIRMTPGDELLRRAASLALAVYYDQAGDKTKRDHEFQEGLELAHKAREASCVMAETWAKYLKRDGNDSSARRVLENELNFAQKNNRFGDAEELELLLTNFNSIQFEKPQLH